MPTSRNPHERMDFWNAKDNGTLYMTHEQLCNKVADLIAELAEKQKYILELERAAPRQEWGEMQWKRRE